MLTGIKVKMSGCEKMANRNTSSKIFVSTIKCATRKFHVATITANKCTKKCAARTKLCFLLSRPVDFFVVLVEVAV